MAPSGTDRGRGTSGHISSTAGSRRRQTPAACPARPGDAESPRRARREVLAILIRHRFTFLLVALLVAIGGHGFVGAALGGVHPLEWLLGISMVAVVFSARHPALRWLLGVLAAGCVVARLSQGMLDHSLPGRVSEILVAVTSLIAAGVAVHRALAAGPVDVERIAAALDAYLLVGLAFGVVYWLMEAAWPGSVFAGSGAELTPQRAIYFSFVTQSTVGFGDIVPIAETAEGLAVVQGVGGQMYLAVLVARLVSLYSAQQGT